MQLHSTIWTILVIGLFFCVADVLYIICFVDRHPQFQTDATSPYPMSSQQQQGEGADETKKETTVFHYDTGNNKDKAPILNLLQEAGVPLDPANDQELIDKLPTWSEVTELYGDKPVIYGLDTCERFRTHSDPADHFVGTAGTFNSGTNLMAELLIANCHMPARMKKYGKVNRGVRWQVPWGKHTPPGDEEYRQTHKSQKDKNVDANNIMPAVTIRDPLVWLQSMCRHHYAARWPDMDSKDHCPNFSSVAKQTTPNALQAYVLYAEMTKYHDSLLYLWNDWYNEYQTAHFPHLFVRFEDLVFHPKEVTKQVCECAGGEMREDGKFIYIVDSAKKGIGAHGSQSERTGYVDAMIKYGSHKRRYDHYQYREDLEYIRDHVDPTLMELMQYPPIDPDSIIVQQQ
eukprot:scaffold2143_cov125-Cylindrotheca_fusiformis.AAC.4